MKSLSLFDIAQQIGSEYRGENWAVTQVCTDTRQLQQGSLFVALKGEKMDGHNYVCQALEQGACAAIVEQRGDFSGENVLLVENTRHALLKIAGMHRHQLDATVVGVTGSVGKTTTKEMIATVVSQSFETVKTKKNLNNEIGLSQMLWEMGENTQVAVLEFGMDGLGQIAPMSQAAQPNLAVLTNIGVSHMEALGSRENIYHEKMDITKGMPIGSTILLNGDDDKLVQWNNKQYNNIFYGIYNLNSDILAKEITVTKEGMKFFVVWQEHRYPVFLPCFGEHHVYDALSAFGVGVLLGMEPQQVSAALAEYQPEGMRQRITQKKGITFVEDCYNASPDSMVAALNTLAEIPNENRKIAVLSDMLELGTVEFSSHQEVGKRLATLPLDAVFITGERSKIVVDAAKEKGYESIFFFESAQELATQLFQYLQLGDIVWVKASRGMKLENVLEYVYELIEKKGV